MGEFCPLPYRPRPLEMKIAKGIHVGTSGWNYDAWKGEFYPEKISGARMLEEYGRRFGNSFNHRPSFDPTVLLKPFCVPQPPSPQRFCPRPAGQKPDSSAFRLERDFFRQLFPAPCLLLLTWDTPFGWILLDIFERRRRRSCIQCSPPSRKSYANLMPSL